MEIIIAGRSFDIVAGMIKLNNDNDIHFFNDCIDHGNEMSCAKISEGQVFWQSNRVVVTGIKEIQKNDLGTFLKPELLDGERPGYEYFESFLTDKPGEAGLEDN